MSLAVTLRIALRALSRNFLRSFLTALGIVVGTGAVISMVFIGEAAKARVQASLSAMGTNLLVVLSGSTTTSGLHGGGGTQLTLTWGDLQAIRSELRSVRVAAPLLRSAITAQSSERNWTTQVVGTTPDYFSARHWRMSAGVTFSQADLDTSARVAVLGQTVAQRLFNEKTPPLGQTVRLRNISFLVVGVMERKGQSATGTDLDDSIFLPATTYQSKIAPGLGKFIAGQILVAVVPEQGTSRGVEEVTALLRARHHIAPGSLDDFSVKDLAELAGAQSSNAETLSRLLASIAAVSLFVGGIGVMNIMLVSVTERTREIGLRMSVGATPEDILAQFLVEAMALSIIGGVAGVLLGILASENLGQRFGWVIALEWDIVLLAVGVSAGVGLLFGIYPAYRASRLNPIEALRHE